MPTKVFWIERTDRAQVWLRRFRHSRIAGVSTRCPRGTGEYDICEGPRAVIASDAPASEWGEWRIWPPEHGQPFDYFHKFDERIPENDPRWPTHCATCGTHFRSDAHKQLWVEHLYRGAPDGKLYTLRDAPPGAMWDAWWLPRRRPWIGADGLALVVRLPNGFDWHVDGPASNCDKKGDVEHFCWCRHGDPRTGSMHVDKSGNTCGAGAGSILAGKYHGFLHAGVLTDG